MVDVDESALCALTEDLLAVVDAGLEVVPTVDGHPLLGQTLAVGAVSFVEVVDIEFVARFFTEHVLDDGTLLGHDVFEARSKDLGVEQVADADPAAAGLVLVGRADPPPRGPDFFVFVLFFDPVETAVIREDDMGAFGDAHVRVQPALAERVEFLEQGLGVDDTAVTDDTALAANDARGQQRELVGLLADDDGVAGVVATLIADDDVGTLAVEIDGAALPFVAQLRSDDRDGHTGPVFFVGLQIGAGSRHKRFTAGVTATVYAPPLATRRLDQYGYDRRRPRRLYRRQRRAITDGDADGERTG